MWPELFGQFWGLVILTVIVVVLANVALILYKHRADEIEQGHRPERHLHRLGALLKPLLEFCPLIEGALSPNAGEARERALALPSPQLVETL
jgi:hypothetical protein